MMKGLLARVLVGVTVLTVSLLVAPVGSAVACTKVTITTGMTLPPPIDLTETQKYQREREDEIALGLAIVLGIGLAEIDAELKLRARCVEAQQTAFKATPRLVDQVPPGNYGVLAGVVIPNSIPCPNDFLVVFVSTPPLAPPQFLGACLGQLPSVSFAATSPISLSDEDAPGDETSFDVFRLPFLIDYPVAYFVALTPPGAPVSSLLAPETAIALTVCLPGTDALGRLTVTCTP